MTQDLKQTPLASLHQELGARMVGFGGWNMPVQYAGILEEVRTVRTRAGLFDLSHMGRVRIAGEGAAAFLDRLATNRADNMKLGQIRYSLLCDESGNCVDDVLMYREEEQVFWLVINAGNTPKDMEWIGKHAADFPVEVQDLTADLAMIALQGPASQNILERVTADPLQGLKYYYFLRSDVCGIPGTMISRTGYTGEDGFELYIPTEKASLVWNSLLEAGQDEQMRPIGLGARDTLRLEAGMPLYGHEIDDQTNPLEAGLGWAVKFVEGKSFLGREALEPIQAAGPSRKLVGFTTTSKRVPRQGYPIVAAGKTVGSLCSGSPSPTLETNIGTGFIPSDLPEGESLSMQIRDTLHPLQVVPLPFYKRKKS